MTSTKRPCRPWTPWRKFTCEGMVTASKAFRNCWSLHNPACASVHNTSAKLSAAFREVSNRRATHEATCVEVKKASQQTTDVKRKATEAHGKMSSHRERSWRVTNEHTSSEAAVNHSLGILGRCAKETAQATLSLTCGAPDRESNEIRYLNARFVFANAQTLHRKTLPWVSSRERFCGELVELCKSCDSCWFQTGPFFISMCPTVSCTAEGLTLFHDRTLAGRPCS